MILYADLSETERAVVDGVVRDRYTYCDSYQGLANLIEEVCGVRRSPEGYRKWLRRRGLSINDKSEYIGLMAAVDAERAQVPHKPFQFRNFSARPVKHLVIPDCQVKPGVDTDHLLWASRYIEDNKPDVVVCLADFWDMESLSSYDSGKKSFEGRRYKSDIDVGNEAMDKLMGRVKKMPKRPRMVFTTGNHEERILRMVESDPRMEGTVGYHDLNLDGWERFEYNEPVTIDGVTYAHFFYNQNTGKPYTGSVDTMLRNIGFTFTMGHQQGLRWARRELNNGKVQIGLVAGSFYQHDEVYRGPQGNHNWRGIVMKHEVADGDYDPMFVSINYLKREYGG